MKTAEQIFHCINDGINISEKWFSEEEIRNKLTIEIINISIKSIKEWRHKILIIQGDKESPNFDYDTENAIIVLEELKEELFGEKK